MPRPDNFPRSIGEKSMGYAVHSHFPVELAPGVGGHGVVHRGGPLELANYAGGFFGDPDNDQPEVFVFRVGVR